MRLGRALVAHQALNLFHFNSRNSLADLGLPLLLPLSFLLGRLILLQIIYNYLFVLT